VEVEEEVEVKEEVEAEGMGKETKEVEAVRAAARDLIAFDPFSLFHFDLK